MKKVISLTAVTFLIMMVFGSMAIAKQHPSSTPVDLRQQSKLEKLSGVGNAAGEAKRDAFALASLVGAGYAASNSFGTDSTGKGGFFTIDVYGVPVENAHGEFLGSMSDIVLNKTDHHAFALIHVGNHRQYKESERLTPVPMVALKISEIRSDRLSIVLNSTETSLKEAPSFDSRKIDNPQYETEIYKYYGIQPYWTDEGAVQGK